MQAQIQALLTARETERVMSRPSTKSNIEVAKLQVFNSTSEKVLGFVTAYKLFLRMRIKETIVEEQIQWMLSYVQKRLVDV